MTPDNLKYVVGKAEEAKPALIRFFGPVNTDSVNGFVNEFLWLQDVIQPSKIVVLINSEGGSVVNGMAAYSVINTCPIEVDCVIEGIAASMGSVIWAAGKNLFMHDYSLLMIHNPFCMGCDMDENTKATIEAFKAQLSIIYQKRFGLSKDKVAEIMDGKENVDGTYLSAKDAVRAGILSSDHIIKTSKATTSKVKNELEGNSSAEEIRNYMTSIAASIDENKLVQQCFAITNQIKHKEQNIDLMNENDVLASAIISQLGLTPASDTERVSSRIAALLAAETKLSEVESKVDELTIKLTGKEAEVDNLTAQIDEVNAALDKYKVAEHEAFLAEVNALVDAAVSAGKIQDNAKESWVTMAQNNFDLAKATLDSIPAREVISAKISEDETNVKETVNAKPIAEVEAEARVNSVVGEKFNYNKF